MDGTYRSLVIMKFNHDFYTNLDFYIYIIVTFFWVLAIPKAGNIYYIKNISEERGNGKKS